MTHEEIEKRVERAKTLFHEGFNCSQAVVASCADVVGLDEQVALRVSASFGGGIGRMRQTCGAFCGLSILEGMRSGSTEGQDVEKKKQNYANIQTYGKAFKEANGSLICGELLGLVPKAEPNDPMPEKRTESYYKKRPCDEMVACAVRLFLEKLNM